MPPSDLAKMIRERLDALGLSQSEAARRAGITRQALISLLRGDVREPQISTLVTLARVLEVAAPYLIRSAYRAFPVRTAHPRDPGDHSSFVRDVTIPDNSIVMVGQRFEKKWEIQNTGRLKWVGRRLVCVDLADTALGQRTEAMSRLMLRPERKAIDIRPTHPGQKVTVGVWFQAPDYPCSTISHWKMVDEDGEPCFPEMIGLWCLVNVVAL